jgi:hypothetical protein
LIDLPPSLGDTPADPNQELPGFASLATLPSHGSKESDNQVISAVIMRDCMKKWEYKQQMRGLPGLKALKKGVIINFRQFKLKMNFQ